MFRQPIRVFLFILLLSLVFVAIDLPENYRIQYRFLGIPIDTTLNPPTLSWNAFGLRMKKTFTTRLGLDLSGGTHIVLDANMHDVNPADRINAVESARAVIERRVNFFGISEPIVQTSHGNDAYRIIVELPGVTNVDQAVATIGQTARLEFRELLDPGQATSAGLLLPTLVNTKSVDITGKDLQRAQMEFSSETGEPQVGIEFTAQGSKKFADVTTRLVGKRLAMFLDDQVLMWPTVNTPITDGRGVITGGFTREDAKILALQLNAGALPVPVSIVEKRIVGASLGAASVVKSIRAGLIGLSIVALFMIVQYGRLGFLADIALLIYGLGSYALFRTIPVTLTLPGVAGFILSIGMAVDSNILIFERYKEERRKGKPWNVAMELGFGRAWESIRDANFTTIITSLILFNPGNWQFLPTSGMVRGFALTLIIGVLMSLFTGIVVTRTLIRVLYREKYVV